MVTDHNVAAPDPTRDRSRRAMKEGATSRFRLEVRLMDDPCLWRWDIKDAVRDAVVQSSWDQEWTAYPSHEEAYSAGRERLDGVLATDSASGASGRADAGADEGRCSGISARLSPCDAESGSPGNRVGA
jgi:hypothetical protein